MELARCEQWLDGRGKRNWHRNKGKFPGCLSGWLPVSETGPPWGRGDAGLSGWKI